MLSDKDVADKFSRFSSWIEDSSQMLNGIGDKELSQREAFSLSSLQLCQEHAKAIKNLIRAGLTASALALLRPQFDALLRGWWLFIAVDDDYFHKKILEKRDFPAGKKREMIEEIKKNLNEEGRKIFIPHVDAVKDFYDDFSHGGFEQMARRLRQPGLVSYTETNTEVFHCMSSSMLYDGLSKAVTCEVFENTALSDKLTELSRKHMTPR